jgi:hypothetical protein
MREQQKRELEAWHAVCWELRELGIDIDRTIRLADAIKLWGNEYAELRFQPGGREELLNALDEARWQYNDTDRAASAQKFRKRPTIPREATDIDVLPG